METTDEYKPIVMKCTDGLLVDVPSYVVEQSEMLKGMDANTGDDDSKPAKMDHADKPTLELVIQWCELHRNDPKPKKPNAATGNVVDDDDSDSEDDNDADADYGKRVTHLVTGDFDTLDSGFWRTMSDDTLAAVIIAANFLDIPLLVSVACKKVALMVEGKSSQELRTYFGIVDGYDDEQEANLKAQVSWCRPDSERAKEKITEPAVQN